jgi:2-keto-3-deoxy-L-rhamnonate aldolase RhmA
MRDNSLRALLQSGKPTLGTHLFLISPSVVEAVGHTGVFDYVEFLAEYAAYDLTALENFCRAAELHSLGTMIKVDQDGHRFTAQRGVGAGFEAVLFADSRSEADVRECVRSVRPDTPQGGGLFGVGARRHALPDEVGTARYVEVLSQIVVAIMIEKQPALDEFEAVLAVPGVDMVQWGPADYSMSIGRPGEWDSDDIRKVERRVITETLAAGLRPRAEIENVEEAKYYAGLGVRDFCLGYDLDAIRKVLRDGGERLRTTILEEAGT